MKSSLTWEYAEIFRDVDNWCESLVGEDTQSKPIKIEPLHATEEAVDELSIKKSFLENETEQTIEYTPASPGRSTITSNNTVREYSGAPLNKHFGNAPHEATPDNSPQTISGCSTDSSDNKCHEETSGGTERSTKMLDITSAKLRTPRLRRFHKRTPFIDQSSVDDTPAAETNEVNTVLGQKTLGHEGTFQVGANNSNNNPTEHIHNKKKEDINQINVKNAMQGTDRKNHDKTKKEPFRCSCCQREFSQRRGLMVHQHVHSKDMPHKCTECPQMFSRSAYVKRHRYIHSEEENPYKCTECPKMFSSDSNLKRHQRIHTGERPFKCKHCPKEFSSYSGMHAHLRTHSGEKPYKCMECLKVFSQNGTLTMHKLTHTGEKPYKCTECPQMFSHKHSLKTHQHTHSGEKPYKCTECPKMFAHKGNLAIHKLAHTGEKPYKCTECPQMFSQRNSLKAHQRTHSGEKPYKCTKCPKMFSHSGNLTMHKLTHTGEKPYKCTECPHIFSQKHSLKTHQGTHPGPKDVLNK